MYQPYENETQENLSVGSVIDGYLTPLLGDDLDKHDLFRLASEVTTFYPGGRLGLRNLTDTEFVEIAKRHTYSLHVLWDQGEWQVSTPGSGVIEFGFFPPAGTPDIFPTAQERLEWALLECDGYVIPETAEATTEGRSTTYDQLRRIA